MTSVLPEMRDDEEGRAYTPSTEPAMSPRNHHGGSADTMTTGGRTNSSRSNPPANTNTTAVSQAATTTTTRLGVGNGSSSSSSSSSRSSPLHPTSSHHGFGSAIVTVATAVGSPTQQQQREEVGGGSDGADDDGQSQQSTRRRWFLDRKQQLSVDLVTLRKTIEDVRLRHDCIIQAAKAEVNTALNQSGVTRDRVLTYFQEQIAALEAEKAVVRRLHHNKEDIIDIQVGNRKYAASRAILLQEKDWLIHHLVSRYPGKTSFFVDRDGDHFGSILQWLRSGYLHISNVQPSTLRQLRTESVFYGLRRLTTSLDSLLTTAASTRHRYAVLTYNQAFQPMTFVGAPPEGIDLFEYAGDCFKSVKDMRKVLTEMALSQWNLDTTISPSLYNGRLVFYKREDHAAHQLLADPLPSKEAGIARRRTSQM